GTVGASDATNVTYLARVREAIIGHNLSSRVIWTGYLSNQGVSAAFGIVDVCVLPYRDGASFRRGSLMAALVHGLPIVSTRPRVPVPELVHGENIFLVPPGDPILLAEAVMHLADDRALRERLRQGARALSRRFRWEEIATRTLQLYDSILRERMPV
ncbi:MAG: glycosyltransferase, partial [Chloroflexi bacterium]|nr:glycosyltransferase [Chloroflexota bacterium]